MPLRCLRLSLCCAVLTPACGAASGNPWSGFESNGADAPPADPAESGETTEAEETTGLEDAGGQSSSGDDGAEEQGGCTKVDFLFVIDNSHFMGGEQARLIDAFPGFMRELQDTISELDYHVMVVTTDNDPDSFDPCEQVFGAGRVRDGAGTDCEVLDDFLNGQRYIDSRLDAEPGDLEAAFGCIANVGELGTRDERVMLAASDALITHSGPGQCNEGFLRDDALLVVTLVTDEEDSHADGPPDSDNDANSPGDPALWHEGLAGVKDDREESVVMLALVGDTDLESGICEPTSTNYDHGAEPAPRLRELAESFSSGAWNSVCAEDYTPFFNEAVAAVGSACRDFIPPG